MRTDRELLELAAKAAGFASIDFLAQDHWANVYDADGRHSAWNPLTDDGDALRLAVKLGMNLGIFKNFGVMASAHEPEFEVDLNERSQGDDYATTRRAIVRVAANIGAKQKGAAND